MLGFRHLPFLKKQVDVVQIQSLEKELFSLKQGDYFKIDLSLFSMIC